jgi:flagellar biosynthesis/type III secretory pathway M-ring protein FliF/YscJ
MLWNIVQWFFFVVGVWFCSALVFLFIWMRIAIHVRKREEEMVKKLYSALTKMEL